jgi:transposase
VRALAWGATRVYLALDVRRVGWHTCGAVKQEKLSWGAAKPFYPKRFAVFVGRRCRTATRQEVARELPRDWRTGKELDTQDMREHLRRCGTPGPKSSGGAAIASRKGHPYRLGVSELPRRRALGFGGRERSEARRELFYAWLGPTKRQRSRLAVREMGKPLRTATPKPAPAPQAKSVVDKFHVLRPLKAAVEQVRKREYARLTGNHRQFLKGQKDTVRSPRASLPRQGRRALQQLLRANKRVPTASLLQESFGQLGDYEKEGWARRFFENGRAALKGHRLKPSENLADLSKRHWEGSAAYCPPENKGALGFVEGLNNKIRVLQRRAYGLRDEEALRLKILPCTLPEI